MKRNESNEPRDKKSLRVAVCTTDNRENKRLYSIRRPYFGTAPEALLEGMDGLDGVEVHVLSCTQKEVDAPAKLGKNIFFHSLLVPRWGWLRTGYLGCARAVRTKLSQLKPDLVHGQGTERDCAMEAVTSRLPNLLTLHGNIRSVAKKLGASPFSYYGLQSLLEAWALKKTGGVLCNSHYTESMVSPLNLRTHLVPNAVRTLFFDLPRKSSSPPKMGLRLLMVGVISPYKQPLEFLRFLRDWRHHANCPVKSCVWVGRANPDHFYAKQFLQEMTEAKSQGWAEHFEELPAKDLIQKMDESDLLVHLPTEEAFGLVVAEAMIRGLPVVATRIGGLPDFAKIYPKICLVSALSPLDWRHAIEAEGQSGNRVLMDSWESHRYHPKTIAQKHLEIYQNLISVR
jgi:glycosyltransferase involved in cell wall biosynthesis